MKTTIEATKTNITFKCEPDDIITVKCGSMEKAMTRSEAVKFFWDEIALGDNLEVEQGAYGLFDVLAGRKSIKTEF